VNASCNKSESETFFSAVLELTLSGVIKENPMIPQVMLPLSQSPEAFATLWHLNPATRPRLGWNWLGPSVLVFDFQCGSSSNNNFST
jgi:hypothetical protein